MRTSIILGAIGALFTGIAIGTQATITSRAGGIIGEIKTGLLTNFLGGVMAGSLVLFLIVREGKESWRVSGPVVGAVAVSGFLGILIITGISFSLQRAGIAAGLATIILGQLVISIIVDSLGIGGIDLIPLTGQRVMGLLVMGFAVYLLLPRG